MYRKIIAFLETWKDSIHCKPLILQGARQVGKTYSILEFGRTHYENVAYFNANLERVEQNESRQQSKAGLSGGGRNLIKMW